MSERRISPEVHLQVMQLMDYAEGVASKLLTLSDTLEHEEDRQALRIAAVTIANAGTNLTRHMVADLGMDLDALRKEKFGR